MGKRLGVQGTILVALVGSNLGKGRGAVRKRSTQVQGSQI